MRTPTEHIKTLQRRVDFLKSRPYQNSFDLAELGSLEWAIVNLAQPKREPLTKEQVSVVRRQAGYDIGEPKEIVAFISGIRHSEAAHGIGKWEA